MLTGPGPNNGAVCLHVVVLSEGAHKFSKYLTGDLKILGARSVTSRRKLHTENPQISGATVQKFGHPELCTAGLRNHGDIFVRGHRNEELRIHSRGAGGLV
jgi:hypothetical protein